MEITKYELDLCIVVKKMWENFKIFGHGKQNID
jgi:hypothetical protein